MTEIDTNKLRALDEEPYLCAGCGRPFIAERSQCDCATGVGFRRSDHHQIVCEQAREVTISLDEHRVFLAMEEDNKRLREALQPFALIARHVERTDKRDGEVVHRQYSEGRYHELRRDDFRRAESAFNGALGKDKA